MTKPKDRGDFFRTISTEDVTTVHVSQGEHIHYPHRNNCLIQVGEDGHYACAYLSDAQVKQLIKALSAFLETK